MTDDELQTLEQAAGILRDASNRATYRSEPDYERLENLIGEADRAAAILRALVSKERRHDDNPDAS